MIIRTFMVMIYKGWVSDNKSCPVIPFHRQSHFIDPHTEPDQITTSPSPMIPVLFDVRYCTVAPQNLRGGVVKIVGTLMGK